MTRWPSLWAVWLVMTLTLVGCVGGELRSFGTTGDPPTAEATDGGRRTTGDGPVGADGAGDRQALDRGLISDALPSDAEVARAPDALRDLPDSQPPDAALGPCPAGCEANAHCTANGCQCDAGFVQRGAVCERPDPCDGVVCGRGGRCVEGRCDCLGGFVEGPDGCTPVGSGPLEMRSEQEVCERWQSERVRVVPEWVAGGGDACDLGQVPADAQANAIRRVNLFRWLAGLNPVVVADARLAAQQACAVVMVALGSLNHQPPAGTRCFTQEGFSGASSSNLAQGTGMADSVDLYVADPGVNNGAVGHRRWVLNPGMGKTAFGYKPAFGCMYAFDGSQRQAVDFVAWPPPGFVPANAGRGRYSIHFYGVGPGPEFSIEVAVDGGAFAPVEFRSLAGGYGNTRAAYTYDPPEGLRLWAAGRTMRVALRGLRDGQELVFETRFTGCN